MFPLAIAACAGVFLYELVVILVFLGSRRRREVEKRIEDLRDEKSEAVKKPGKLRKDRSLKKEAGARTRKELEKLENQLYDAGIQIPVMKFLGIWLGLVLGITVLLPVFGVNTILAIGVSVAVAIGPVLFVRMRKNKRRQVLESQLVEAISILCNALRAGHSFQMAMQNIADEMTGPISEEFGRVFLETQHGMTMADSFERMTDRCGSDDLEMLCTAILIQRDIGGNLAEVLENISGTVKARLDLKAEIKTRTSSGRLSGYIVGALPILLMVVMTVINPDYCKPLFEAQLGHILLSAGAVMEVVGFIVINKMVSVKY